MHKRHYFIGEFDLKFIEVKCLDTEIIHQIRDVLKMEIKEEVVLCDGQGKAVVAEISGISKKEILFSVKQTLPKQINKNKVVLYAAMLKGDNFEWLLQKVVETGVDEIVPLTSERTIKTDLNFKRGQKIIKEATEQCERQFLPVLDQVKTFKDALKSASGEVIFFDPSGEDVKKVKINNKAISVFIGPEGGWSDNEIELAQKANVTILNLGSSILRGETAATAATYLAKNVL
ncbi:MAG: hypothetical protein ACD_72C00205G0005 [uncultured bacterium]|nr:MAG: hypothetical protein ACD_72C00205G0005 [uncultured bacterium]